MSSLLGSELKSEPDKIKYPIALERRKKRFEKADNGIWKLIPWNAIK